MISEEIYSLIGSESFIMVNKKLLRSFGGSADSAVLLIELVNIHKMMANKLMVDDFGYFKIGQHWIKKVLGMSPGKQKTNLNNLVKMGLINVMVKGYPASRHISLNFINIKEILEADETTKEDIQRKEFYDNINAFLNAKSNREIIKEKKVFGNIGENLRNTIKYLTIYYRNKVPAGKIEWTPKMLGVTRNFVNSRSLGKPYDYAFLWGVLFRIDTKTRLCDIPDQLVAKARGCVEKSPADQILDFEKAIKELIK